MLIHFFPILPSFLGKVTGSFHAAGWIPPVILHLPGPGPTAPRAAVGSPKGLARSVGTCWGPGQGAKGAEVDFFTFE